MTARNRYRPVLLVLGPAAGGLVWLLCQWAGMSVLAGLVAGLTVWVASWWIFEPIPMAFTSLMPLAILPLAGVLTGEQVGAAYGNPLILLLLGGFMLSQALAKSGVHRRLALGLVRAVGGRSGRPLVFGFMLAASTLSLWMSNTATSLMLLPIALAVLEQVKDRRLCIAVLLAVAYGASIGGMGTPIGTPPNLIFLEAYRKTTGLTPGFMEYMSWAMPVVLILVPVVALWLSRGLPAGERLTLPAQGPWRTEERRVLGIFAVVAVLWITRTEPLGGWSRALELPGASDAAVALLGCVVMALTPNGRGEPVLDWEHAVRIPWGILLMFGSGMALATGFEVTGVSDRIGAAVGPYLGAVPLPVVIVLLCLSVTFLSEITSNTATATLLLPILGATAVGAGMDPLVLMLSGGLAASCGFMLPAATGPNAVVFGAGRMTVAEMAREGLVINLLGTAVISAVIWLWVS